MQSYDLGMIAACITPSTGSFAPSCISRHLSCQILGFLLHLVFYKQEFLALRAAFNDQAPVKLQRLSSPPHNPH